ncbi:MAG: YabP/YqfC family sporulation protein [Ruminococcus sp.]|nr:YabP/YqfC family sporulation protein [Ruminococcus sp.]
MFESLADMARDSFYLEPQIYFDCNNEMLIENCRKIEEYNEIFMQISSGRLCIRIWGEGLSASDFRAGGLIIRGKISKVEFSERSRNHHDDPAEEQNKDMRKGKEAV